MTSSCAHNLWDVNDEVELLDYVEAYLFQLLKSKLLYITKRTRQDIEPALVFLITGVVNINVDGWKKLRRYISYLNQMVENVRIIGGFNLTYFFTWFDAPYDVHPTMRIQKVRLISMGYEILHCLSSKKNQNEIFLIGS